MGRRLQFDCHGVLEGCMYKSSLTRSWQVAYAWAFIVKFDMKAKIRRLECLEE